VINETSKVRVRYYFSKDSSDWVIIAEDEKCHLLLVFLRFILFFTKTFVVLSLIFLFFDLFSSLSFFRIDFGYLI